MDVQGYATADIAVCAAVIALLHRLCDASAETLEAQKLFRHTDCVRCSTSVFATASDRWSRIRPI